MWLDRIGIILLSSKEQGNYPWLFPFLLILETNQANLIHFIKHVLIQTIVLWAFLSKPNKQQSEKLYIYLLTNVVYSKLFKTR